MKRKKYKIIQLSIIFALLLLFILYCFFENTTIETTELNITNSKIPTEFDEYKIVHISDLHNAEFGDDNNTLLDKIKKVQPNALFITGDIVDSIKTNFDIAVTFLEKAIDIAPIYYVTGNHEASVNDYSAFADQIKKLGVALLDNQCVELDVNGSKVNVIGFADPQFINGSETDTAAEYRQHLEEMNFNTNNYTILLSHRPELFDFYVQNNIDLVFSGHAHGGQFRLPFIGGLVAPNQGLFPPYTAGKYERDNTTMIVSRGLGNSIIPIRINNNPEIVVVTLKSQS